MDEIDEMVESLNGKEITYDQLNQMKFLGMVVNEGLRRWPPTPLTIRHCTKDYALEVDGKTYSIKKGTSVYLAFGSMLKNPKYFENPEKFDPCRFSDENKGKIVPGTFIPFGLVRRF